MLHTIKLATKPVGWHRQGGFTLLDTLIAILLIAIGLVGLLGMALITMSANVRAREITEAAVLAQDKIEEIRSIPPNVAVPPAPADGEVIDARGCLVTGDTRAFCATLLPGQRYIRTWLLDTTNPNRFEVRLRWEDPANPDITDPNHYRTLVVADVR